MKKMKKPLATIVVAIIIFVSLVIATVIWFGCRASQESAMEKDAKAAVVPVIQEYPITPRSKFATRCPYCNCLCVSKSCTLSGSTSTQEGNLELWSISYLCSKCDMPFVGMRNQSVPQVSSFRLRSE